MLTFDQVADITGVDKEMLQFLNPSYKLDIIPKIDGKNYALRLPRDKSGLFVSNESEIYEYATEDLASKEEDLPQYVEVESTIRYRVKSGDFLGKIAAQYGVSVSSIKRWNNLRSDNLRVGQRLTIHPRSTPATERPAATASKTYVVKQGDTLWSIARKLRGVTIKQLKEYNNLSDNSLKPGMELKISKG